MTAGVAPDVVVRVLVADDNACSRMALEALLATVPGVAVSATAADGAQAIAALDVTVPDVVVMDVRMPGMDGIEATRQIKERWPSVTVLVLSVCAAYRDQAISVGADQFLVKGGPIDDLVDAVKAIRDRRAAEARREADGLPVPKHRSFATTVHAVRNRVRIG